MKTLDLCDFPLDSLSLIEASAGTGKTYAVANLYLRYLLERKLGVDEILVVTFTEAATQELRDRIRARIQELSQVFSGVQSDDEVLNSLFRNSEDLQADKLRLRIAERQIDQAEIHTIHGFCQQLLVRYALDLNVSLSQTLIEDSKPLLLRVCEDFWRKKVLKLPQALMLEVYRNWATPDALMNALEPMINRRPEVCNPHFQEGGLSAWEGHYHNVWSWHIALRDKTAEYIDEVQDIVAASGLKLLNKKLAWLSSIRAWSESELVSFELPKAGKRNNLFEVFTPESLLAETKKNCQPPVHSYFSFLEEHLEKRPAASCDVFLVQCYQEVSAALKAEKESQSAVSFDDLILSVSESLSEVQTREVLISSVRERFSVALIDEFQDTDRDQYHIFSSIFASSLVNQKDASMVLIGDPKQAIYAFRGGDIATYLRAKQDISAHSRGHLFTMDTNWRSSPEMVNAVNQVFLKRENAFIAEAIPFLPVKAARATPSYLERQAAFNISLLKGDGRSKSELDSVLANHTVQQILSLLAEGSAAFSDVAVLVRSSREAELIKDRLSFYGLGASYEGKSNIYDSEEAQAIYSLLAAMAEPANEYLIMHCLSDLFFCVDDARLREIKNDDKVLEYYLEVFNTLHICWLKYGVLAAVRKAMSDLGVFDVWRSEVRHGDGQLRDSQEWERRLTNVNQLAELLQRRSQITRGHFALLRWLRQNISASTQADDESRLRLESDDQLIRIITIHKSKGLEYPYVFLPFVSSARGPEFAWFYDDSGKLNLDLLKLETNDALVERERLAEDIRLLYVALTRAKYQCYLNTYFYKGRGASLGISKTAWAYLIARESVIQGLDEDSYNDQLQGLAQGSDGIIGFQLIDEGKLQYSLSRSGKPGSQVGVQGLSDYPKFSSALLETGLRDFWRIQSFTGLIQEAHSRSQAHLPIVSKPADEREGAELSIFDFPRGSKAGTFLHTLFESIQFDSAQPLNKLDDQGVPISLQNMVEEKLTLSRLVDDADRDKWSNYLSAWLINILKVPIREGFSLSDLPLCDYQVEMEFIFKVDQCNFNRFNELLNLYMEAPPLEFSTFEGHLKGAIDLVFVQSDKFYLLDYKSNYLGDELSDYSQDKLHEAMLDHRYDLQYLIYSVALHRYLKMRLGERYSYEKNFGGVYYLYLRGMPIFNDPLYNEAEQNGVYFVKPKVDLIAALDRHLGASI